MKRVRSQWRRQASPFLRSAVEVGVRALSEQTGDQLNFALGREKRALSEKTLHSRLVAYNHQIQLRDKNNGCTISRTNIQASNSHNMPLY